MLNSPAHWRKWAVKMRAWAANIADRQARATLLEIAVRYEKLAELAQERELTT